MQASDHAPSRRALTAGLVLTVSMAAFEALAVATVLPETVREIGGLAYYGWAFAGFMLANLIGIPLSGRMADQRGPRPPFVAGLLLFAGGLAVAGLATSMQVLVAGRVLQGAGAAALSTVAYVAVARAYPVEAQPRMMALLSSAWVVPGLFGPALAAGIARAAGWRVVFLGLVPATLTAGALALTGLRGLAPPPPVQPDPEATPVRDAVLLAAGVALTLLGVRSRHLAVAAILGFAGAGLAGHALLRLLPAGTLRARPGLPAAIALLALINFAFFTIEAFLPLALTGLRGRSTGLVAAALTAGTLAWTCGSWLQARAPGRRPVLWGGLVCLLVGLAAAATVPWPAVPAPLAVPAWAVAGLGMGIAYQAGTLAVLAAAPVGREGEITARMQIANSLAVALGTGLGGDLLSRMAHGGQPAAGGIALVNGVALLFGAAALAAAGGVTAPASRRADDATLAP